jgi:hypothetical protein
MIEYLIKQYTDDIYVSINNQEFLTVKRKFNILGKLTSRFYQSDKLILETSYDIAFFRKYLVIIIQNLPKQLDLKKVRGIYLLNYENVFLRVKRKYFKNPVYQLYANEELVGEVETKVNGFAESPTRYKVLFYRENEMNYYLLLLFLMNLSPTMDV